MRFAAPLLIVLLLSASTAFGAIGAEFAISAPSPAEAASSQTDPAVASNGSDYFAVWLDARRSTEQLSRTTLYGSRVDTSGHLAEVFGTPIADNIYRARIASAGRGYLLVYSGYGNTFAKRITDDGHVEQGTIYVGVTFIYALASNGSGYCALMSEPAAQKFAVVFFDAGGVPHGGVDLGQMQEPVLLVAGTDYRIIDQVSTCDGKTACKVGCSAHLNRQQNAPGGDEGHRPGRSAADARERDRCERPHFHGHRF